jgi:hypothetical protein
MIWSQLFGFAGSRKLDGSELVDGPARKQRDSDGVRPSPNGSVVICFTGRATLFACGVRRAPNLLYVPLGPRQIKER